MLLAFFDALADGKTPEDLNKIAGYQYDESFRKLETVWRNTIDAQVRKAEELKLDSRPRFLPPLLATFQKADGLLKAARKADTMKERIDKYREAACLLEDFIKRLEVAN